MDMDEFWDVIFYRGFGDDFLWKRSIGLRPDSHPFTHSKVDYDKEIVLAKILDPKDDSPLDGPSSIIR